MRYDWRKGLTKAIKYAVLFGLPVLVDKFVVSYPAIAQLSIGAAAVMAVNYLKVQVGLKLP